MLTRRNFLRGAGALTAAPLLAACSGVAGGDGGGDGAKLQLAWWGGNDRVARTQKVLKLFNNKHKKSTVTGQFTAWDGYWQKLDTEAAGGSLPDLIQMDMGYIGQFTGRHQLLDLSKYRNSTIDLGDFDKPQLDQTTVGGKLYGISLGGNLDAAFYNKTMIEATGVAGPAEDLSWEDLASWCGRIAKKLPEGSYPSDDGSGLQPAFEVFIRQRHGEMWTKDGKLTYTVSDVKDWFQYWADLRSAELIVPGTVVAEATQNGTNQGTPLVTGKAAFSMTWSNFLGQYQILMKDSLGMMRLPTGGSQVGDYVKVSMMLSISAKSEHPDDAAAFIDYFIQDPAAVKVLGLERGVPASASVRDALKPSLKPYDAGQVEFFDKFSGETRPKTVLDPPAAGEVGDALTRAAQSIPLSKKSVAAAAEKFMEESEKAVSS